MVFFKKLRFIFIIFISIFLFCQVSAVNFPSVEYTSSIMPSGQVDILGKASSGVGVKLYVNSNYISKKNVFSSGKVFNLSSEILDQTIAVGANLRFVNSDPINIFVLNFSGIGVKTLNPGDIFDFKSLTVGRVNYKNEKTGAVAKISVINELANFSFTQIPQNYLLDGANSIRFDLLSLDTNSLLKSQNFTFFYQKYSNQISLANFSNITNKLEITLSGSVSDPNSPLKYVLNHNGQIANLGLLKSVFLNGSNFNLTIPNLKEGVNSIRFISLNKDNLDIFNGERIEKIFVDTVNPQIVFNNAIYISPNSNTGVGSSNNNQNNKRNLDFNQPSLFLNGNTILLNFSTDGSFAGFTLNNQNKSCSNVINFSVTCSISLNPGKNNFTLFVFDRAGNLNKQSRAIWYDNQPILIKSITPKTGTTVRFFLQDFNGQLNKPNVNIIAFSIPQNAKYSSIDRNGNQVLVPVTCANYNFMGKTRPQNTNNNILQQGSSITPTNEQISLLDLVQKEVRTTSDANGNFKIANLILKEATLNKQTSASSNNIASVKSQNQVCFVFQDQFGSIVTSQMSITLDQGNVAWVPIQVTPTPSTIGASEIEQISINGARNNIGGARFGVIARIAYKGGGKVDTISQPQIRIDSNYNAESRFAKVISNEASSRIDKNTGEMIIYFPVELSPLGKQAAFYPKQLKLGFALSLTYTANSKNIPIDTTNPVFFQAVINIDRPLDSTKWLSPKTIGEGLKFLNQSISLTTSAAKFTGLASVAGVLACTGARFVIGTQIAIASAKEDNDAEINDLKNSLYTICDRVVCSAAPKKCDSSSGNKGYYSDFYKIKNKNFAPRGNEIRNDDNAQILTKAGDKNEIKARIESLDCSAKIPCVTTTGMPGFKCSLDYTVLSKRAVLGGFITSDSKSMATISNSCREVQFFPKIYRGSGTGIKDAKALGAYIKKNNKLPDNFNEDPIGVNVKDIGGICYKEKEPRFDGARTLNKPGWDSKNNIIESIGSACITDTYSHLKNYLKIQQSIRGCLQAAQIGRASGSYCEKLISQAVCDVATSAVYTIMDKTSYSSSSKSNEKDPHLLTSIFSGAQTGNNILDDRYSASSFYSQAGMGNGQVVNKVCLASLTGNWNILTENILSGIDKNEVKPTFGPLFPTSRMQGYNPLTGDLSIRYKFTYATVSGGSFINTKVEFICDSAKKGGEYCPQGRTTSDQVRGSRLSTRSLFTSRNGMMQDSIIIDDNKAKVRYNLVRLTHTYKLNGETKVDVQEEELIKHQNRGLLVNCHWNGGSFGSGTATANAGISCDTLFGPESLVSAYNINSVKTHLSPNVLQDKVFYEGNNLYVNLAYDIRDKQNTQGKFNLLYKVECRGQNGIPTIKVGSKSITPPKSQTSSILVDLFKFPNLNEVTTGLRTRFKANIQDATIFGAKNNIKPFPITPTDVKSPYFLKIRSNNERTVVNFGIKFIKGFNIDQIPVSSTADFNGNKFKINEFSLRNLELEFINKVDLSVEIVDKDGNSKLGFGPAIAVNNVNNDFTTLQNLIGGNCKLDLKIAPPNTGNSVITPDLFDAFKPFAGNGNGFNIKTFGVKDSIFTSSFQVTTTPTDVKNYKNSFEIISPTKGASFCITPGGTMDLSYLVKNSNNLDQTGLRLTASLTAEKYNLNLKKLSSISKPSNPQGILKHSVGANNLGSLKFKISNDNQIKAIAKNSETLGMNLNYNLFKITPVPSSTPQKYTSVLLKSSSIPFFIKISNNCN